MIQLIFKWGAQYFIGDIFFSFLDHSLSLIHRCLLTIIGTTVLHGWKFDIISMKAKNLHTHNTIN